MAHRFLPTVIGSEAYRKKIIDEDETFTKQFVVEKAAVCHVPFQHTFLHQSITNSLLRSGARSERERVIYPSSSDIQGRVMIVASVVSVGY